MKMNVKLKKLLIFKESKNNENIIWLFTLMFDIAYTRHFPTLNNNNYYSVQFY